MTYPSPVPGATPETPVYASPGSAWAVAPPPPKRFDVSRGVILGVVVALMLAVLLAVLGFIGYNIGVEALIVGTAAAVVPVPFFIFCFLWLDRYEPEPVKLLAFCFGWGAAISTGTSLLVNSSASNLFERNDLPDALVAVLVAPFVEELTKALGPILLFIFHRRAYSGIIDGLVYCGMSAIGFAMVENILYLGGYGWRAGAEDGGPVVGAANVVGIFIGRVLLSGFAHPLFTAMTGIGLGMAARARDGRLRWIAPIAGLIVAMMLHGAWNSMATFAEQQQFVLLYGYFAVMMPIFFGMIGFALWLRAAQGRLTEEMLPGYVRAGWFSPPEVPALASLGRRAAARRWAKRIAGDAGLKAMRAYQFDATKLALLRDGMGRGIDTAPERVGATLQEERRLLDAITAYRRVFTGRDPQTPAALWDGTQYHLSLPDGQVRLVAPPEQPVMPVPVVLPRPLPVGYHPAGYAPAGYPPVGYAPAGHPPAGHAPYPPQYPYR